MNKKKVPEKNIIRANDVQTEQSNKMLFDVIFSYITNSENRIKKIDSKPVGNESNLSNELVKKSSIRNK